MVSGWAGGRRPKERKCLISHTHRMTSAEEESIPHFITTEPSPGGLFEEVGWGLGGSPQPVPEAVLSPSQAAGTVRTELKARRPGPTLSHSPGATGVESRQAGRLGLQRDGEWIREPEGTARRGRSWSSVADLCGSGHPPARRAESSGGCCPPVLTQVPGNRPPPSPFLSGHLHTVRSCHRCFSVPGTAVVSMCGLKGSNHLD